ncbi:MAG: hypothetical protein JWM16_2945 [Verrucomicrobiales bacterium]|nr:hypothetical protein [Verrucomicrobiales bacterium]
MSKLNRIFYFLLLPLLFTLGCTKQAKMERHLKRANSYYAAKDYQKAEIEYLTTLQYNRTNLVVIKRLASIYEEDGKVQRMIPFLMAARDLDKNDIETQAKLAQILLQSGQIKKAREEAITILDRSGTNEIAIGLLADTAMSQAEVLDGQKRLKNLKPELQQRAAWQLAMATLFLRLNNSQGVEDSLKRALALEPQSSSVHMAWGKYSWQKGDLKSADQEFQKAAELAPVKSPARLNWAEFKLLNGQVKEAGDLLNQWTAQAPNFTAARLMLAGIAFDKHDYSECSNIVQSVLLKDPDNYQAHLYHARLYRLDGKTAEALRELEQLKKINGSAEVSFEIALCHLRSQDRQKAISSAEEALTLNPGLTQATLLLAELNIGRGNAVSAIASLRDLTAKQPTLLPAQLLLASAYTAQGRMDDALTKYRELFQMFPTNPSIPYFTGLTLRQQNKPDEARKAFESALTLAPNDSLVSYQLVDLEIARTNYPAAQKRVTDLLKANPKSAPAKFLEAKIYLAQKQYKQAEDALNIAIEWDPNFASAYDLLAQTYVAANRLSDALAKLQQMMDKDPRNERVLMVMAAIYEKKGDKENAAKKYREVLNLNGSSVVALNNLAFLLLQNSNTLDEALKLALRANELFPSTPALNDTLGWVLFQKGDYARALTYLRNAASNAPEEPEMQYHLGLAFYMMGQDEAAITALKRAAGSSREFPGQAEAKEKLAFLLMPSTDIPFLEKRFTQAPRDTIAALRLATAYENNNQIKEAQKAYLKAKEIIPESPIVLQRLAIFLYSKAQDPKQALAVAKEARALRPDDPEMAHLLGRLLLDTAGDERFAVNLLEESVRQERSNPNRLLDLAEGYFAVGRLEEAEQNARQSLVVGGKLEREADAKWLVALAGYSRNLEELMKAERQIRALAKSKPNYLPVQFNLALIERQKGNSAETKAILEKMTTVHPQFGPGKKAFAQLSADKLDDPAKSLELALEARKLLPNDSELSKLLGRVYLMKGDPKNALGYLRQARQALPNDPEILYYLGMTQFKLNDKVESMKALAQAIALSPNAAFVPEAQRTLAKLPKG